MELSNIFTFIKNALPVFSKSDLESDLDISIKYIKQTSLDSYRQLEDMLKVSPIKSTKTKKLVEIFYKNLDLEDTKVRLSSNKNLASDTLTLFNNVITNSEYIQEQIDKYLSDTIVTNGISSKKAFFLRAIGHFSFIGKFSSDLANYIYINEALEVDPDLNDSYKLAPKQIANIEKNIWIYARLLSVYGINNNRFIDNLSDIKEISIPKATEDAVGLYADGEVDLFSNLPSKFIGSPIYQAKLIFAQWSADRYKELKDKKKLLELRYLHLKLLIERGEADVAVEREMENLQKRIADHDFKINKIEAEIE